MDGRIPIPIPKPSAEALRTHKDKPQQNPGLIFDRFAPGWWKESELKRSSVLKKDDSLKKLGLDAVRKAAEKADGKLLQAWNARWEASVRAAGAAPFELRTDWRFVAGLGRKGPLEVGFTFHRYGFPILPGSSVKGIARTRGLIQVADKLGETSLTELDNLLSLDDEAVFRERLAERYPNRTRDDYAIAEQFRTIFGTVGVAGKCVFFDAIPASPPHLELDIMNPHFPDYYQDKSGKTPPTDSQSPRPVYFLTVAPGTESRFAVGWRGTLDEEARSLQKLAQDWLIRGLEELGAGAKTSAGYGYFLTTAVPEEITRAAEIPPERTAPAEAPESDLVRRIRSIPHSQVKGSIGNLADQWRRLPDGAEKLEAAQAFREQMEKVGILKDRKWLGKDWVVEVLGYLQAHGTSNAGG